LKNLIDKNESVNFKEIVPDFKESVAAVEEEEIIEEEIIEEDKIDIEKDIKTFTIFHEKFNKLIKKETYFLNDKIGKIGLKKTADWIDDSYESKYLRLYNIIINKFFNTQNTEIILNFKTARELLKEQCKNLKEEILLKNYLEFTSVLEYIYYEKYSNLVSKIVHYNINNRYIGNILTDSDETQYSQEEKGVINNNIIKREAKSYAFEGFVVGIKKYNPKSKTKLFTYVHWWIQQRVVYFIERKASINSCTKSKVNIQEEYTMEDMDNQKVSTDKYQQTKYINYAFVSSSGVTNLTKDEDTDEFEKYMNEKYFEIIKYLICGDIELLRYYEYLILKYDILLDVFIGFVESRKDEEVSACFFKDLEVLNNLTGVEEFDFKNIKFYEMSQNLEDFFKLEHTEYLKIRRNIKQKLVNLVKRIHNKAFGDDEQEEED